MGFNTQELGRLGAFAGAGIVVGLLTGAWGWATTAALVLWLVYHGAEFQRFARWAEKPLSRPDNRSPIWQLPTDRLFRSLRAARQRAATLLYAQKRIRVINEALPDGAVLINGLGEIEDFNPSARALLGLQHTDIGQNLVALVRVPQLVALVDGQIPEQLIEIPAPVDSSRRLEIRRIPVDPTLTLVMARDVTQLNRLLSMRQDFIANVSHELRTPLSVVVGYLEALEDRSLDVETVRTVATRLAPPVQRMQALVDDLLLLTRLESSPTPADADLQLTRPAKMLRGIVDDACALSNGRHGITLEADATLGLLGAEHELQSAFGNLVANAIRYSPDGGDINVRWLATSEGPRFEVEDHGVGIAPEHISRLTERFYRVDFAGARIRGGTGLGLAIVKHVLKRHDTRLQVLSEVGRGSRFFCVFPQRRGKRVPENDTTQYPTNRGTRPCH